MVFILMDLFCIILFFQPIFCHNASNSSTIHTVVAAEGQNVTLPCPLNYPPIPKVKVCEWLLPDGNVIFHQNKNERFIFSDDNWALILKDIKPQDGGTYTCIVGEEADCKLHQEGYVILEVTLLTIQMSPWEMYQPQFVRGMIAAAVVVFVLLSLCLIYKFRWKSTERRKPSQSVYAVPSTCRPNQMIDEEIYSGAYIVYNNEGMVDVPL